MSTATAYTATAEPYTSRQFKARQSRTEQGWLRSEFIACRLKVCRQTAYNWDLILLETIPDYSDGWQAGKPWNAHQMWALLKVKQWMGLTPKPTLEDLKNHLGHNQHLYNHQQFFKEYFKYDTQGTSKKP